MGLAAIRLNYPNTWATRSERLGTQRKRLLRRRRRNERAEKLANMSPESTAFQKWSI